MSQSLGQVVPKKGVSSGSEEGAEGGGGVLSDLGCWGGALGDVTAEAAWRKEILVNS